MSKSNNPAAGRRGRDPGKESYWRQRLSDQARSGLTVRAFCEREALKETAFYFWRLEIGHRDRQAVRRRTPALAFVQVHAAPMPAAVVASEHDFPLELVFSDHRRLLIRAGCDATLLAKVVSVLEGRPC